MFRHERPQKGRQRQFHQIGIEAFGFAGPDIDAELIMLCSHLWEAFDIDLSLEINSLGTVESRQRYRQVLVDYFKSHKASLDEDSLTRLENNPLRILDSKNPEIRSIIQAAPVMNDYLDDESAEHFQELCSILDAANICYDINPRLVRGLDYYGKTVFEWVTNQLGAQGTVCAGGRYDGLVEMHGSHATPAVGFAIGMERLLELIDENRFEDEQTPHIYLVVASQNAKQKALLLSNKLRKSKPKLRVITHLGSGSIKSQFKKADKSGARYALVLGDDEIANNSFTIKDLRNDQPQRSMNSEEFETFLENLI